MFYFGIGYVKFILRRVARLVGMAAVAGGTVFCLMMMTAMCG